MTDGGTPACFARRGEFARDLQHAADDHFAESLSRRRDMPAMYLKTAVILLWLVGSWVYLVFWAQGALTGILAAVSLGFAIAAVGMAIQHDANHGAYSRHGWINRVFGATLDLMGVSSLVWRSKHNVAHHTFTNIENVDFDLDFGVLARLSPSQPRRPWHRYQQYYLWILYGFLLPKWVFFDDFIAWRTGRIGVHTLPPRRPGSLVAFIGWKLVFVAWAIAIPALIHPWWTVLVFHAIAVFTLGTTLGTVFQLAHCTTDADFPTPGRGGRRMPTDWATHQLATTADFARESRLLTWFVGGLNHQVEHHLFPKVCHLHYPALSRVVERVARKHGLRHRARGTLWSALAGHFAHLRRLGRDDRAPT